MAAPKLNLHELAGERAQLTRAAVPYTAATTVGLATHVGLLLLFSAFAVWPMAAVNVVSVLLFALVRQLFSRGRVQLAMLIATSEVVVHQVLAVGFCGWEPGFQYYLFVVVPLVQMLPGTSRMLRHAASAVPLVTYFVLAFVRPESPSHAFPSGVAFALGAVNLATAFGVCFVFIHYYRRGAENAETALSAVAARSEQLLHGILPPLIVDRLRERSGVVADRFDETTVLFADLVGFTTLAQKKSPEDLVVLLDEVFAGLDALAEERGLEKIKTIGDAYMVAAGVPSPMPRHAEAMADFALAACAHIATIAEKLGEPLAIRVGMHMGPVVAGVIGRTKFAYDLWGDVVNTASRMESHGEPGRIHVTEAIAKAVGESFRLSPRGTIEVKGKGAMKTFWLEGRLEHA